MLKWPNEVLWGSVWWFLFNASDTNHLLFWDGWKSWKLRSWSITDSPVVSLRRCVLKDWQRESVNATYISMQLLLPHQLLQTKHLSYSTLLEYIFPSNAANSQTQSSSSALSNLLPIEIDLLVSDPSSFLPFCILFCFNLMTCAGFGWDNINFLHGT